MNNDERKKILIYPKHITDILEAYDDIIAPRKLSKDEHLKIHHKYISNEFENPFRVEDFFLTNGDTINYTVKILGINRYATISLPTYHSLYEIVLIKDNLLEKEIINEDKFYYGYKIKRWFYERIDKKLYFDLLSYILYDGNNCLNDNKLYKIEAEYINDDKFLFFRFVSINNKSS